MKPLPEEKLPKKSQSAKTKAKFNYQEIHRLTDRIIAYADVDRDNNTNICDLLEDTRRQLLRAHFIRQKRKRKN